MDKTKSYSARWLNPPPTLALSVPFEVYVPLHISECEHRLRGVRRGGAASWFGFRSFLTGNVRTHYNTAEFYVRATQSKVVPVWAVGQLVALNDNTTLCRGAVGASQQYWLMLALFPVLGLLIALFMLPSVGTLGIGMSLLFLLVFAFAAAVQYAYVRANRDELLRLVERELWR